MKYRVTATMTISVHVDVEAESPEQAKEIAEELPPMTLCHQCASSKGEQWSTSGELDGQPENLEVEEA